MDEYIEDEESAWDSCCFIGSEFCGGAHFDTGRCTANHGTPCSTCRDVVDLEKDMLEAWNHLQRLAEKRRTILKEKANNIHDPIIQRLPVELIELVFEFYVESHNPFRDGRKSTFSKIECSAPFVISSVCKAWRKLALSTPRLWTRMNIYIYSYDSLQVQSELASQSLKRSKKHGIRLSIFDPGYKPGHARQDNTYSTSWLGGSGWGSDSLSEVPIKGIDSSPLMNVLKSQSSRWQMLDLAARTVTMEELFSDLVSLPALEYLHIYSRNDNWNSKIGLPKTPLLRELELSVQESPFDLFSESFGWARITRISLGLIDAPEVFEIFRHAPLLEEFVLSPTSSYDGPGRKTPITHSNLKLLQLNLHQSDHGQALWKRLTIPSLQTLVLDIEGSSPPDWAPEFPFQHIVTFLARSRCVIRTFKLKSSARFTLTDEQLIRILEHMPSLTSLTFHNLGIIGTGSTWTTDTLWKRFCRRPNGHSSQSHDKFPLSLRHLELAGVRAFSWKWFLNALDVLRTRNSTANNKGDGSASTSLHDNRLHVSLKLMPVPTVAYKIDKPSGVRFKACKEDGSVVLKLTDYLEERDLLEEALVLHGLAEKEA